MADYHALRDGTRIAYRCYPSSDPCSVSGLCLIAHPWGRLGGSQCDHVVVALATALSRANFLTFTYDARGAGESAGSASWTGKQEVQDYEEVLNDLVLPKASGSKKLLLVGYSAGSLAAISTRAPANFDTRYVLVAFPLGVTWALTALQSTSVLDAIAERSATSPVLAIHGDRDQFTSIKRYDRWCADHPTMTSKTIAGADHFWQGLVRRQMIDQVLAFAGAGSSLSNTDRNAPFRPEWHFTPRQNWMNDPNGLVFFEGEYHLFFQYNPFGNDWGHMSWGHAISRDLVRWDELPVAIPETERDMVFSGSAVIDHDNTSGLGDGKSPPLLAYYTAFDRQTEIQTQHLAYSHDRGRTFASFDRNPLIDLDLLHFRDPKVFRHEASQAWVMVVALSREHKVHFYRSTDLLSWSLASSFGPAGATGGQWECPDLILVPIDGEPNTSRWMLKIDVDAGFVGGGSGAQYFIGDFDGFKFETDSAVSPLEGQVVDFGSDFYASASWSNLPAEQASPIWIGWMSNLQTGRLYPTGEWRGAQSLPRTLFLFSESDVLKIGQRPIDAAVTAAGNDQYRVVRQDESVNLGSTSSRTMLLLDLAGRSQVALNLECSKCCLLSLEFDREKGVVRAVRGVNPLIPDAPAFRTETSLTLGEQLMVDFWLDGCLCEIFINGGRRVYSACVFPSDSTRLDVRW